MSNHTGMQRANILTATHLISTSRMVGWLCSRRRHSKQRMSVSTDRSCTGKLNRHQVLSAEYSSAEHLVNCVTSEHRLTHLRQ